MSKRLNDIRIYVVRPACERMGMWSQAAENLVVGTGLVESQYQNLDQTTPGPGPAYGPWQMEKLTHDDLWVYLAAQPSALRDTMHAMAGHPIEKIPPITCLHWNLLYGAGMCRLHYRRIRKALPAADDFEGLAAYWKQFYNTPLGAGTIEKAIPYFKQAVIL